MAIPTFYGLKFYGSGSPQAFPVLAGTTLGTQIGSDFPVPLETTPWTTPIYDGRAHRRIIEAFGKTFAVIGNYVCEKDQGGVGNWGAVLTISTLCGTGAIHGWISGMHLLHPGGVPTLAFLCRASSGATQYHAVWTKDGVTWNNAPLKATAFTTGSRPGDSVAYRDSIFWVTADTKHVTPFLEYNFLTSVYTVHYLGGTSEAACYYRHASWVVRGNKLYCSGGISGSNNAYWGLFRLDAGFALIGNTNPTLSNWSIGNPGQGNGSFSIPDGDDIVAFQHGYEYTANLLGTKCVRWTDVDGSIGITEETNQTIPSAYRAQVGGSQQHNWVGIADNNSSPGVPPTYYLWFKDAAGMSGTWSSYTYQFRALAYTGLSGGPFIVGEYVTGASGAVGRITQLGTGQIHLTDVSGTFHGGGAELITGQTSGATATTSALLAAQPLVSNGTSISAYFAIAGLCRDSIGPYIPTYPQARAELGTNGILLTHGVVTGPGWTLNETITGAGGATATLIIDNTGTLVVYPTNSTAFINGEVITGGSSGSFATLSAGPTYDTAIPPIEVIGGTKFYFQVYGTSPATVTLSLYGSADEESTGTLEIISSVTLESGTAPGTMPSISGGTIINMPPDSGVRLWSLVHNANAGGFAAGDSYKLSLDAV